MKIYNPLGVEILDIIVDDSSYRYRAIMSDTLTLKFSVTEPISIPVGSYVEYEGVRYALWYPENLKKHNTRNFEYTLVLQPWPEALKLYLYKDLSAKPYRVKFPLVATPDVFIQLLVDVLNLHDSGWTKGGIISSDEKLISFNHENCYEALNRIAQEFDTEWEIINKTIHLRRVEKFKDDPLPLSYGKGNGFVSGVGRVNDGDRQPIGRMYVEGGERNIDFSKYASNTLLLPKSASLLHNGKTYETDEDGMYIFRVGNNNKAEGSYDGSKFYPKRVGAVSSVEEVDVEQNFYDIIDLTIPESLNYKECRIAGEKATIIFQSGVLAGREFDIEQTDEELTGYIHEERRFKIVPAEFDGYVMPGGLFVPKTGDKYAIFNISMPEAYIRDDATMTGASWDMFKEAVAVFAREEEQKFTFTGQIDGIWSKSRWLEIGGKFVPGGHILFSDEQFLPDGAVVRITGVKDYVNRPHKPEITLSNASMPVSLGSVIDNLETDEVIIEESKKEAIRFTKRRWRDTKETMSMLKKSLLNFSGSINPIAIQTMQLLVGDESLQFRFVNSKTAPSVVEHVVDFDVETKLFTANAGIIQHMTLGISEIKKSHKASDYKYWDMSAYESPALEPDKSYYLYAKCATTGNTGQFLLSESAIKMNAVPNYYHFLVGILNSEFDEVRSYVQMYGFTEVLPGRITTDKIVSTDGTTYFDLVNSVIAGKIKFLSNGVEKDLSVWADSILNNLNNTDQTITDLEDYLNDAFHDGVIEEAEAKAIETYINQINTEKAGVEATYNKLYINPILQGTAKSNLLNAKISFFGAVDNLISSINAVIADGKVTASEKQSINAIFNTYRTSYATFSTRIEEAKQFVEQAIKSIADDAKNAADNAQSMSSDALAAANTAKAITDKFGTTVDGGLISTVMMLLREFNSIQDTAGLSGIQGALKNNPAFWAGGTYAQAFALIEFLSKMSAGVAPGANEYGNLAKITLLHNGAAKIGDFIIEPSGRIVMVDPTTGIARLVFGIENIPTIASLQAGTVYSGSTAVGGGNTASVTTLSGSTNVTKHGATASFSGTSISISATGKAQANGMASFAVAELYAYRNGVKTIALATAVLQFSNTDNYQVDVKTVASPAINTYLTDAGTYTFKLEVIKEGDISFATGECTPSNFSWSYTLQGIRRQQYGLDGMMFYYSNNHFHFTEGGGLDLRGAVNIPGVLFSGTVNMNGGFLGTWGAKKHASLSATRQSVGVYAVYHSIGHTNYFVNITPSSNRTFYIGSKSANYFIVYFYSTSSTPALSDTNFDFQITGNNYA